MATLRCRGHQDLSDVQWLGREAHEEVPYYALPALEGRGLVSAFGPAPAWLGYLAGGDLEPGVLVTDRDLRARARTAATAAVAVSAGLLVVAAAAVASLPVAVASAMFAALSFAGAPTLAQGLWQQTAELPFLTGALAAALWSARRPMLVPLAVALAATASFIRPADAPLALCIAAAAAWPTLHERRSLVPVAVAAVAACVAVSPIVAWDLWYLDSVFPTTQIAANQRLAAEVFSTSPAVIATAAAGLLVSPGKGLLLFAPFAPVAVALGFVRRAGRGHGRVPAILAAGIVGEWLLSSLFFKWWGGAAFGPRLLAGATWVSAALLATLSGSVAVRARVALLALGVPGAALGLVALHRFDLTAVELRVKQGREHFSLHAGPWMSLRPPDPTLFDAPEGPFVFCAPWSLTDPDPGLGSLVPVSP